MRSLLLLLFVSVVFHASRLSCAAANPKCAQELIEAFFEERDIATDSNGKLKFTPKNIAHFKIERENARRFLFSLNSDLFEIKHAIRAILEARMIRSNAWLWGEPGGAKTELLEMMFHVPVKQPDGTKKLDIFSLNLNQLMSDSLLRGFIDPQRLKLFKDRMTNQEAYTITMDHLNTEGTMIHSSVCILEEIHNGNPMALAALQDFLETKRNARFGQVNLATRIESVYSTSNTRVEEFIKIFLDQGMEPTARALMDRNPFRIYLTNYVTDANLRELAMARHGERFEQRAREALRNNRARFQNSLAVIKAIESDLPEVDWVWLGNIAVGGSRIDRDTNKVIQEILHESRKRLYALRRASEEEVLAAGLGTGVLYYPTIFSMRNNIQFARRTIAASVFLELLALPDEILPSETLIALVENKIPIDRYSTWRVQDVILTAAPGDPVLNVANQGGVSLDYGPQVAELLKDPFDQRAEAIHNIIQKEREEMKSVYEERMRANQAKVEEVAEVLSSIPGFPSQNGNRSLEMFLSRVAPRHNPN
jgi:MoxR-like ATPase